MNCMPKVDVFFLKYIRRPHGLAYDVNISSDTGSDEWFLTHPITREQDWPNSVSKTKYFLILWFISMTFTMGPRLDLIRW